MSIDTTTAPAATFFGNRLIVAARDNDGAPWMGTDHWLVRSTLDASPADPQILSNLVGAFEHRIQLARREIGGWPVFVRADGYDVRVYDREDGEAVFLRHDFCRALERSLEKRDLYWWQPADKPLGPVAVTTEFEQDAEIRGLVMCIRVAQ